MICKLCATDHPGWDVGACRKARHLARMVDLAVNAHVNAQEPVNAVVNAQPKKSRSGSKHPPGYMAEYMRKRREAAKGV